MGGGLTDLVAVVGILHVVWVRRQWVQIILALSQQACCGETELGAPAGRGSRALRGGPSGWARKIPADSDSQDAYGLLSTKALTRLWSRAGSLTSPPCWLSPLLSAPGPLHLTLPGPESLLSFSSSRSLLKLLPAQGASRVAQW